jgi:CHRD domain
MRRSLLVVSVTLLSCSMLTPAAASADQRTGQSERVVFLASLTGAAEVPGPGDPDGRGLAVIRVDRETGQICYVLTARRIEPATAAHIHIGSPEVAGPVVQGLASPTDGVAVDCVDNPALADAIAADPGNYYVNVHNTPFPAGAIRGTLTRPGR